MAASMPPHGPAPGSDTTLPPLLSLIGKQCFKHLLMPADFPADVIGKPSICSHGARMDAPKDLQPSPKELQPSMPSAFRSATDSNWWCLRGCRRGTLSGRDAAPEPTWTYLRRVPRRCACKRPQQTEAFAQNPQTPPQGRWHDAASRVGTYTGARRKSMRLQESWNTKHQQQAQKRPADHSAGRQVCIVQRMSGVTPPQPSCPRPRRARADATGDWPRPARPVRWLR